jgi:hypothetical protein
MGLSSMVGIFAAGSLAQSAEQAPAAARPAQIARP